MDGQEREQASSNQGQSVDKVYILDTRAMIKMQSKASTMAVLGGSLIAVMFSNVAWWAKCILGLGAIFLVILTYYEFKYFMGIRKRAFELSFKKKEFQYFNEFEGNKLLDIDQMREIKVYRRRNDVFLLEIFMDNQKREENVYLAGFDQETIHEMIQDLADCNPKILFTTNQKSNQKQ